MKQPAVRVVRHLGFRVVGWRGGAVRMKKKHWLCDRAAPISLWLPVEAPDRDSAVGDATPRWLKEGRPEEREGKPCYLLLAPRPGGRPFLKMPFCDETKIRLLASKGAWLHAVIARQRRLEMIYRGWFKRPAARVRCRPKTPVTC